jgi:hypothetical protein
VLKTSSQLREASVAQWASQCTGLSDVRDLREVQNIAAALDAINARDIARAVDILCQRILSIQVAKGKGGSWEKSEQIELIPPVGKNLAPGGMLAITGT